MLPCNYSVTLDIIVLFVLLGTIFHLVKMLKLIFLWSSVLTLFVISLGGAVRVLTRNTISSCKYSLTLFFHYSFKIKVLRMRPNVKENSRYVRVQKVHEGAKWVFLFWLGLYSLTKLTFLALFEPLGGWMHSLIFFSPCLCIYMYPLLVFWSCSCSLTCDKCDQRYTGQGRKGSHIQVFPLERMATRWCKIGNMSSSENLYENKFMGFWK